MSASVWKKVFLGKIGNFSNGINKPKDAFGHGTKFVNISDVFQPILQIRDLGRVEITNFEESYYGLQEDDILFVRSSVKPDGVGYNTIFDGSSESIVFCGFVIRFRKSFYEVDAHFLNYLLRSPEYRAQIISYSTVSANTNINQVSLKKIEIIFPQSLAEQKHISDILSSCDSVIQNTQKVIDKYKAIKQGMMHDLFTRGLTKDGKLRPSYQEAPERYKPSELGMIPKEWEKDCIGNNYITYAGGTPSREHDEYYKGDIPWVTSSECNQLEINDTLEHITNIAVQRTSTKMVKAGAILLALYGATAGQVAKLNLDATTNQAVLACLSDNKNDNIYLLYYFGYIKDKMLYLAQGSGQPNLSKTSVDKFVYLKPDKSEQIAIAKRLSSIDSAIQKEEAMLEKYKNIKTGLMARLLTPPQDAQIIDETEE